MRSPLVVVAAIALAGAIGSAASRPWAAAGSSPTSSATRSGMIALPPAVPTGQVALYGHIKRLARTGARFELGFDPAWLTSGITASRAKLRDAGSSEVPNDSYTIDEGHRLLTYRVPSNARVTSFSEVASAPLTGTSRLSWTRWGISTRWSRCSRGRRGSISADRHEFELDPDQPSFAGA